MLNETFTEGFKNGAPKHLRRKSKVSLDDAEEASYAWRTLKKWLLSRSQRYKRCILGEKNKGEG